MGCISSPIYRFNPISRCPEVLGLATAALVVGGVITSYLYTERDYFAYLPPLVRCQACSTFTLEAL